MQPRTVGDIMLDKNTAEVICAVRNNNEWESALSSASNIIFYLSPDILTLNDKVRQAHQAGKKLFIHLDLANGIGRDKSGITYVAEMGVDGIISTRTNIIKLAREAGLFTVQRFFIVDSQSAETTVESLKISKADMIEIMPGVAKTIEAVRDHLSVPIIAGGLISTREDIKTALGAGAMAISTGNTTLWN